MGDETGAALASQAVTETDLLLSVREPARPLPGSGRGDDGSGADDSGDDWGWSEGPFGHDDDERPYRRSRIVRAMALVTAVTVVVGSIGTWVAILAVGPPAPSYAVSAVHFQTVPGQRSATTTPRANVTFVVANESSQTGRATCRAVVSTSHGVVGASSSGSQRLSGGESESLSISVPLSSAALSGNGPAGVQVTCGPTRTSGSRSS